MSAYRNAIVEYEKGKSAEIYWYTELLEHIGTRRERGLNFQQVQDLLSGKYGGLVIIPNREGKHKKSGHSAEYCFYGIVNGRWYKAVAHLCVRPKREGGTAYMVPATYMVVPSHKVKLEIQSYENRNQPNRPSKSK